jgi:hypothetical protein
VRWVGAAFVVVVLAAGWGQMAASGWRTWIVGGALPVMTVYMWVIQRGAGAPRGPLAQPSPQARPQPRRWADLAAAMGVMGPLGAWWVVGAWAALTALWTPYPGAALWTGAWLLGVASAQSLGAQLNGPSLASLRVAVIAGGVLASAPTLIPGGPVEGTFGNPDNLAALLSLTLLWTLLPATEGTKDATPSGWASLTWRAPAAAAQGAALWLLNSLGAWVAVAAGLIAVGCAHLARRGRPLLAAFAAAAAVTAAAASPALSAEVAAHVRGRLFMARVTWEVIRADPLAGVGAGHLPCAWSSAQAAWFADPSHHDARDLWTLAHHAHNEWLHMAAELGLIATLCWALPLLAALRAGPRLLAAPWASAVAFCVLSLVTMPLYEPATAFLFALSVGALLAAEPSSQPDPQPDLQPKRPPASPRAPWRVAAALAGLLIFSVHTISERLTALGLTEDAPAALSWAVTLSMRPAASMRHLADAIGPDDPVAAAAVAAAAAAREPSPRAWAFAGQWAMRAGALQEACDAFQRAIDLHPWFFTGHYNLSLCAQALGDTPRALRHAERARSLLPADPRLGRLPSPPPTPLD